GEISRVEGMLAETELCSYRGNKIVEVKPVWANKGALASELLTMHLDAGFIFGIGDDCTDEDLFAQLPANAWSVHVGVGPTRASYRVPHPAMAREVLTRLATGGS
ncbi:MAG: trehalose-phosphatase, partial [Bryobacteraceae bacterium]